MTGAVVAPASASAGDQGKTTKITAQLNGAQEVDRPGDTDGTGVGVLTINRKTGKICYRLSANNIASATAAHIHEAVRGAAGPVVETLTAPTNGRSAGCLSNAELAKEIVADPADYYLNVHNAEFKDGAIRGQLG